MTDAKIVREFNSVGPCRILGRLVKETEQFYLYNEWLGGEHYGALKRVRKQTLAYHSGAHIEPCRSCRDHAETQYPQSQKD